MRIAEQVTFGGGGLDRAAQFRGESSAVFELLENENTLALTIWRGKPLTKGGEHPELALLPIGSKVLREADEAPCFLGIAESGPLFAYDISGWEPQEMPDSMGAFFDPSEQRHPLLPEDHRFSELRGIMARTTPLQAEVAATAKAILGWHESHGYCARCGAKTVVAMAGWQRDCPACGGHHFPRTDPVVIMLITSGNKVLMGRSPHWPEGMYSLLAGFVEPGETIETAVRREVAEETAIPVGTVQYLASQPWPFPSSLMIGAWGEALGEDISIDPKEIEHALWVTREEMMQIFAGGDSRIKPARNGSIAHFILQNWLADRLD